MHKAYVAYLVNNETLNKNNFHELVEFFKSEQLAKKFADDHNKDFLKEFSVNDSSIEDSNSHEYIVLSFPDFEKKHLTTDQLKIAGKEAFKIFGYLFEH